MELNTIENPDKGAEDSAAWAVKWTKDRYIAKHRASFEIVDAYLNQPVGRLLDIGCGFAWQSRWFNEKYGTELWLVMPAPMLLNLKLPVMVTGTQIPTN